MNNSVSLKIKLFIAVISIGILYTLFVAVMASLPVSSDDKAIPYATTSYAVDEMSEEERQQALDNYQRFKEEVHEKILEQGIKEQIEYIEQQG